MIKKLIALALIFALVFPAVALAKGKPADTGKGAAVGRPDKPGKPETPGRPESPGKSGEHKGLKPSDENGQEGDVTKGKPEKPGEKGRMNAISRIWAHIVRIMEILLTNPLSPKGNALRGLTNAIPNIGKKVGYNLENLPQPSPKNTEPEEPPTTEPIEQPAEQL